jgi:Tfp pilus assembly protein PilO
MSPRVVWLMAALVLAAGYALVYEPSERNAAAQSRYAEQLYREARANEAELQRAAEIREAQVRVRADLDRIAGSASTSAVTVLALHLLNEESRRFRIDVRTIEPEHVAVKANGRLERTPVVLGLRGYFRNIVALLSDLSRHDVLIGVDGIDLAAGEGAPGASPLLDGTVHLSIYRLRAEPALEDQHAAANF